MSTSKKIVLKSSDGETFEVEEAVALESQTIKHAIETRNFKIMSTSNKIVLKSSDGETFEVEEAVALESQTIKYVIEDCADNTIPLPNVTSSILAKVIEYCKKHVEVANKPEVAADDEAIKEWEEAFVSVDQAVLFDLIRAANYLNIRSLLNLTCQTVADMIKGKTPVEIRQTFDLKNDFTPEEEEEVRRENPQAFEPRPIIISTTGIDRHPNLRRRK